MPQILDLGYDPKNSGTRLAELDMLRRREADVDAAAKLHEISLQPEKAALLRAQTAHAVAQTGYSNAQTRKTTAEATKEEADAAAQQKILSTWNGGVGEERSASDPADQLEALGQLQLKFGAWKAGTDSITAASQHRQWSASEAAATALALERQGKAALAELQMFGGLISTVTDQASLDAANKTFRLLNNKPSPLEGMQYNPQLIESIPEMLLSEKERIDATIAQTKQTSLDARRAVQEKVAKVDLALKDAQIKSVNTRLGIAIKEHGENSGLAAELRKAQKLLTDARAKRLNDMMRGRSEDNPLRVIPEASARTPGAFYTTPKGVMQWHPNGWVPAGSALLPLPRGGVGGAIDKIGNLFSADDEDEDEED